MGNDGRFAQVKVGVRVIIVKKYLVVRVREDQPGRRKQGICRDREGAARIHRLERRARAALESGQLFGHLTWTTRGIRYSQRRHACFCSTEEDAMLHAGLETDNREGPFGRRTGK